MNRKRLAALLLGILICVSGCGLFSGADRVIVTNGFRDDEIFRVGNTICGRQEMLVYLVNLYNSYPADYPRDDAMRESCLSLAAQIKAMNLLAERLEITLTPEDREKAGEAAKEYADSLTEADLRVTDQVTADVIRNMYLEIALADKVYAYAIRDINPEISDDEARTITVEQIVVYKGTQTERARAKIQRAQAALSAGEDFSRLLSEYNEADADRVSFGTGEGGGIPEDVAFALESGETSDVLETDTAFYLLRCVSSFDREQTRENKRRIVERRRREAFGRMYETFSEQLPVQLNEEAWDALQIPDFGQTTDSFWDIYETYFSEETL